jgi:hypothetical protein
VNWLRRVGRHPPPSEREPDDGVSEAVETAAPGVAALLRGMSEGASHAVLDLGTAAASSLSVYGRFARQIRFADVPGHAASLRGRGTVARVLETVPVQPERPYDLVFAWDVLDRIFPAYHAPLVARLVEVTAPDARLHVVVRASEQPTIRPLRFMLLDIDRMRYEPTGPAQPGLPRLLPAQLAHLIEPFRVVHGYTLKGDLREYVAARKGG